MWVCRFCATIKTKAEMTQGHTLRVPNSFDFRVLANYQFPMISQDKMLVLDSLSRSVKHVISWIPQPRVPTSAGCRLQSSFQQPPTRNPTKPDIKTCTGLYRLCSTNVWRVFFGTIHLLLVCLVCGSADILGNKRFFHVARVWTQTVVCLWVTEYTPCR